MHGRGWVAPAGLCALLLLGCRARPEVVAPPAPGAPAAPPAMPVAPRPAAPEPKASFKRGTIFFLKGDARLSPGALERLQTWTTAWGAEGTWVLAYPADPGIPAELLEKRLQALRAELQKRGVTRIELRIDPKEPAGQYDPIRVEK